MTPMKKPLQGRKKERHTPLTSKEKILSKNDVSPVWAGLLVLVVAMVVYFLSASPLSAQQRQSTPAYDLLTNDTSYKCPDCSVFLIVIDSLRRDHLGVYGYDKNTTPNIDLLAEKSFVFTHMFSTVSWTTPSVATLLTSLYPPQHGARKFGEGLGEEAVTLPELLSSRGYVTASFVANPLAGKALGLSQGFYIYQNNKNGIMLGNFILKEMNADKINNEFLDWFEQNKDKKMFVYLHYNDVHLPYNPPAPYNTMFDLLDYPPQDEKEFQQGNTINRYDGEIAYADSRIGTLLSRLEEDGVYGKSIIVITADHGEEFYEHGQGGHGKTLYDEVLRVPLIIHTPQSNELKIVDNYAESVETPRYILNLLDIDVHNLPQLRERPDLYANMTFSELIDSPDISTYIASVRTPDYRYICDFDANTSTLFNVSDPGEKDVSVENPGVVKNMLAYMDWVYGLPSIPPQTENVSKEIEDELRNLGYMV
jgi:arylsulfatase A-like enzyme